MMNIYVATLVLTAALCHGQNMMMGSTTKSPMMMMSTTMKSSMPMMNSTGMSNVGSMASNVVGQGQYNNQYNSNNNYDGDAADYNTDAMTNVTGMDAMNATAEICDDISDVLQMAMNATTYIFSNKEIQSFMAAQDGMDWLWRPSGSARWCKEACIAVNKTMCPSDQLDNPMMHGDMCRTCVLECLACTYEDNYWMTLRAYVMTLMAPLVQLVSSTMAVDMSDMKQAQMAQHAQQMMYDKFNAAVAPLNNRMRLDRMFNLNCQMFASYVSATDSGSSGSGSTPMMGMSNMRSTSTTPRP